ncbi:hypothetical protein N0V95_004994 [Ascochyta clinopodiicola]|nr:hypothetical protein N0V95_004994 [Ascochyta clinopodiicola]
MDERCGFIDVEESENADASVNRATRRHSEATAGSVTEHTGGERLALDELKEHILGHDSFEDMLAIVRTGISEDDRYQNASKVLHILGQLDEQQVTAKTKELGDARDSAHSLSAEQRKTLSRLDVLKQMFDAFFNRLLAYSFQTHVGLVTFGSSASISQPVTHAVENFRHQLNNMVAAGDTAIWDSITLASDQLQQYAAKYPKAKLRIICISDGEDNKSARLTLSYMTGGYKFQPASLEEAMAICEMEPVLSLLERPAMTLPRTKKSVAVDQATLDEFPQRKPLPQLSEPFVELKIFARHATSQVRADSNLRASRIHMELCNYGAFAHPHYDIYICEPNFGLWKIVMQGPPESIYAGKTFLLYVEMGEDYPMLPPKARFVTPVYHPNINRHGRICHSIFDRNWTVDTTIKDLIDTIYSLLLVPEFCDPINTVVTLNYHWDEVQFKEEAQQHIRKHATKSRAEWRQKITG